MPTPETLWAVSSTTQEGAAPSPHTFIDDHRGRTTNKTGDNVQNHAVELWKVKSEHKRKITVRGAKEGKRSHPVPVVGAVYFEKIRVAAGESCRGDARSTRGCTLTVIIIDTLMR